MKQQVTKHEKEAGRVIPKTTISAPLTDSLTGILKGNYDLDREREEALRKKYEMTK